MDNNYSCINSECIKAYEYMSSQNVKLLNELNKLNEEKNKLIKANDDHYNKIKELLNKLKEQKEDFNNKIKELKEEYNNNYDDLMKFIDQKIKRPRLSSVGASNDKQYYHSDLKEGQCYREN